MPKNSERRHSHSDTSGNDGYIPNGNFGNYIPGSVFSAPQQPSPPQIAPGQDHLMQTWDSVNQNQFWNQSYDSPQDRLMYYNPDGYAKNPPAYSPLQSQNPQSYATESPQQVPQSTPPLIALTHSTSTTQPEPKPRRKGGRKPKNDPLPPHLEERRRLRRIRNKEAAQKCREKEVAQTKELSTQINQLETKRKTYEESINQMKEYKDQCEIVLNNHKCQKNNGQVVLQNTGQNLNETGEKATSHPEFDTQVSLSPEDKEWFNNFIATGGSNDEMNSPSSQSHNSSSTHGSQWGDRSGSSIDNALPRSVSSGSQNQTLQNLIDKSVDQNWQQQVGPSPYLINRIIANGNANTDQSRQNWKNYTNNQTPNSTTPGFSRF